MAGLLQTLHTRLFRAVELCIKFGNRKLFGRYGWENRVSGPRYHISNLYVVHAGIVWWGFLLL